MAQISVRLNVTASQFPFLSDQVGATVIVPNQDTYYVRPNSFTGETADKNIGIPQFTFLENVMPTSFGVSSVGFNVSTTKFPGDLLQADQVLYLRSRTGRRYLANFNRQNGKFFIYSSEISAWKEVLNIPVVLSQAYTCLVKGRCFFGFKNHAEIYEFKDFNSTLGVFEFTTFASFGGISDLTQIFGLVSANNYLILFTRTLLLYTIPTEIYGSVPDFTPSLGPTGAASETPSILKGIILTCLPTQDGFHIFTSTNTVTAFYSGNIRFPWTFRELEGSAAINTLDVIAVDRDGYPKYCYTTAGLLKIGKSSCTPAFVEASEFIGNNVYEYFDWTTKSIIRRELPAPLSVSLAYIAGRWLVLSYGAEGENFSHAIIWDEHLKRWGKVQIEHTRALEFFGIPATLASVAGMTYQDLLDGGWTYQDLLDLGWTYQYLGGVDYAGNPDIALEYKSLGFITKSGEVNVVDFSLSKVTNRSVIYLGRVQFTRSSRFKILTAWAESMNENPTTEDCQLAVLCSNDTRNVRKTVYGHRRIAASGGIMKYLFKSAEGLNHQLRFEGDFDLSSIVVVGRRTGTAYI